MIIRAVLFKKSEYVLPKTRVKLNKKVPNIGWWKPHHIR